MADARPWTDPMPEEQFGFMRDILAAPSPIGLESAMTMGVLKPYFDSFMPDSWAMHRYVGNAGVVWDSHPGEDERFSIMLVGHADKIRLQVRKIGADGKIWINSDSFLDLQIHGKNKGDQIKRLGVKPGDSLLLNRPIKRGFSPDTFFGAYLDNGLGCFVTAEVAKLAAAAGGTKNVRCLYAIASHEARYRGPQHAATGDGQGLYLDHRGNCQ